MTTGTVGKDFSSALLNLAPAQGGRNAVDAGGFQKVWNSQMNRGGAGGTVRDNSAGRQSRTDRQEAGAVSQEKPAEGSEKAEKAPQVQQSSRESKPAAVQEETGTEMPREEFSPEELQAAMEVLGSAAMGLMEQLAQMFGISMEELEGAMEELGLGQLDILDAQKLGSLVLALGGAQDKSALIMDETLYGSYRALMESLEGTLQECAGQLGVEPGELERLIEEALKARQPAEEPAPTVQETLAAEEILPSEETFGEEPSERKMWGIQEDTASAEEGQVLKEGPADALGEARQTSGQQETGEKAGRQGQDRHGEKSHQEGVFVQDFKPGEFSPQVQRPEGIYAGAAGWDADTKSIMNQIMDYMKMQLGPDTTSLEMQLHPASLGTLHVQLETKGGMVTANFITQNEAVKAALESQIVQLRESFEAQGVRIEAIEVTVQTHEFERNLEQGRGREQQEPQKRSRTRRINLRDPLAMEGLEEEEALAAEVRAAGGSTVEYAV